MGRAYKVKKLAAQDSHFLLNNLFFFHANARISSIDILFSDLNNMCTLLFFFFFFVAFVVTSTTLLVDIVVDEVDGGTGLFLLLLLAVVVLILSF